MATWKDTIGNIYNNLLVLKRATKEEIPWKSHETPLWVKCQKCEYEWVARKGDIEKGIVKCPECGPSGGRGHWDKSKIGMRFGKLTIIDKAPIHRSESGVYYSYWKCKCDCGNIVDVRLEHLLGKNHSRTISCGCYSKSSGELKIEQILNKNNINYQEQYQIKDFSLFSLFDFAIFKEEKLLGLIEYDGEQHFKAIDHFGGEEEFIVQQERDKRKNEYCKNNNIKLIRIPYTDYDKITEEYLFSFFPELKAES